MRLGAVEVGGTKVICLVGSGPDEITSHARISTGAPGETVEAVRAFFQQQVASGKGLAAIGIASFGPVELRRSHPRYGFITTTPKPGWSDVDIRGPAQRALGVLVGFDTDVNGAALGEGRWGAARERHSVRWPVRSAPSCWLSKPTKRISTCRRRLMPDDSAAAQRARMYGENDLSSMALFSGNFINFGYWQDFTPGLISVEQRTESQADLYRTTLRSLMIDPADIALEVGCGIAVGAALALREFQPHAVYGLDLSPDQLSRAIRVNAKLLAQHPDRLIFQRGSALALPFADGTFDKCYSVEAAQHFEDLTTFACEAHRILRPGGRLAVSTFFTPHAVTDGELRQLIHTIDNGIDIVGPIDAFRNDLLVAGFVDIRIESIGNHVWHGFDAWIDQTEFRDGWGRNWLRAYQRGLIDYYLITAGKQ